MLWFPQSTTMHVKRLILTVPCQSMTHVCPWQWSFVRHLKVYKTELQLIPSPLTPLHLPTFLRISFNFITMSCYRGACCSFPVHRSSALRSSRAAGCSCEVNNGASRSVENRFGMKVPTCFGTVQINESNVRRAAQGSRVKASRFARASNTLYNGMSYC